MATQRNSLVDETLRSVASMVACEGTGTWRVLLADGETLLPAKVRVSGEWLELTALLPECPAHVGDDLRALRVNSYLPGPVRMARHFGEPDPYVRADACLEHNLDLSTFLEIACTGVATAVRHFVAQREGNPAPLETHALPFSLADVAHACAETGWRPVSTDSSVRADLITRAGVFNAHLDSAFDRRCFVVELIDLSDAADVCRHAVGALLMAVSSSFRLVKGGLIERNGISSGALLSELADASERSVDGALSALAAACQASAREAQALFDARVASEYLALSGGGLEKKSDSVMEETCLQ